MNPPGIGGRLKPMRKLVSAAGISPDDLLITLYEASGENISFGRGLANVPVSPTENREPAYADRSLP